MYRNLTRKDLLKRHLERQAAIFTNSRHAKLFQCMPTTFSLPREYAAFEKAFADATAPCSPFATADTPAKVCYISRDVLPCTFYSLMRVWRELLVDKPRLKNLTTLLNVFLVHICAKSMLGKCHA
jgi:hypothetical protein